nr:ribonuclease H-like domain-containing protein [Tanacetum cinerariifolium]
MVSYKNYTAVPPPYTGNFMPLTPDLSFTSLDEFVNKHVVENCKAKSSKKETKVVRKNDDALIIEEWVADNEEEDVILGKVDEGFFVGYSLNSKAFRVFNSRTRIAEENLHIRFSEKTPNIAVSGPNWFFDIDALTKSMNYKPVVAGNQSNGNADTKACDDAEMPALEDISTFNFSSDHDDEDKEADMNDIDTTIQVSHVAATRIHKNNPLDPVIGNLHSTTQTRKMSKNLEEHGFVTTIHQRTNHKDLQNCLFVCFLSQEEPKKVIHALKDPS